MKYVLMIYQGSTPIPDTEPWHQLDPAEQQQVYADYAAINDMEHVQPGPPLGLPGDATTVRVVQGDVTLQPGSYLEPSQAVGGFAIVEAESFNDAVAVAAALPPARLGGAVEVRPVATYW